MKKDEQPPMPDDKNTMPSSQGEKNTRESGTRPFTVDLNGPTTDDQTPLQPHERDETSSGTQSAEGQPREVMKQAYKDIEQGQVDTDLREQRGVEKTVDKSFKPATAMPERKQERS
ncbi:MAG: hypothetical protein ABWY05_11955 [Noviherbaspirillum sp.]